MERGKTVKIILEGILADMLITEICELAEISRSTANVHLRELVKKGYIRRLERHCPYEVTENGKKILD